MTQQTKQLGKNLILPNCGVVVVILNSVTRFGDLLNFGQVFKAFGNN